MYKKFVFAECQLLSANILKQILSYADDAKLAEFWRQIKENGSVGLADFSNETCAKMH